MSDELPEIKLPEPPLEPRERMCEMCGVSLEGLHGNFRFCRPCDSIRHLVRSRVKIRNTGLGYSPQLIKQMLSVSKPAEYEDPQRSPGKPRLRALARYTIPLGENEAMIAIYGDALRLEDFDALMDYVSLFKKQFERKQK